MFDKDGIHLSFNYIEETETTDIAVSRAVIGEESQYLPRVLDEFRWFLNSVGFTYVTNIAAFNEDGEEVAATEL